jgi:hypothetical protein
MHATEEFRAGTLSENADAIPAVIESGGDSIDVERGQKVGMPTIRKDDGISW